MPGLPRKFAKMGFAKGWKAFRASHNIGIGGRKKHAKRKHHYYLGGDMSVPALVKPPVRSFSKITPEKIFSPIIDLGLLIVGMSVGAAFKKAAPIKNPHIMNGMQTVVGIGGSLMTKNRFVKMPLIGLALQSTISEAKILMPKMLPIAGDDEVIYLPAGEEPQQIEYQGEDDRVGAVYDGENMVPVEIIEGEDERVGAVYDGESEGEYSGEGSND